jgi:hypothetical protein
MIWTASQILHWKGRRVRVPYINDICELDSRIFKCLNAPLAFKGKEKPPSL